MLVEVVDQADPFENFKAVLTLFPTQIWAWRYAIQLVSMSSPGAGASLLPLFHVALEAVPATNAYGRGLIFLRRAHLNYMLVKLQDSANDPHLSVALSRHKSVAPTLRANSLIRQNAFPQHALVDLHIVLCASTSVTWKPSARNSREKRLARDRSQTKEKGKRRRRRIRRDGVRKRKKGRMAEGENQENRKSCDDVLNAKRSRRREMKRRARRSGGTGRTSEDRREE